MKTRTGHNPKRRLVAAGAVSREQLAKLAGTATYEGNPQHKRLPGDFGLTPPGSPRPGKTLCDGAGVFRKEMASALLRAGFEKGMISEQRRSGWPQNVWSAAEGVAFEAELHNEAIGSYHGYPMPLDDDFRVVILQEWSKR